MQDDRRQNLLGQYRAFTLVEADPLIGKVSRPRLIKHLTSLADDRQFDI